LIDYKNKEKRGGKEVKDVNLGVSGLRLMGRETHVLHRTAG